jgi:hypothetical protein
MRLLLSLTLIALLGISQSVGAKKLASIADVQQNLLSWSGEIVLIEGWVWGCHGDFACYLSSAPMNKGLHSLTIDFRPSFEPKLHRVSGMRILLKAKVTSECAGENICTDRAPEIIPIRIVKVFPEKPSSPAARN